jgi:hypothetical protein
MSNCYHTITAMSKTRTNSSHRRQPTAKSLRLAEAIEEAKQNENISIAELSRKHGVVKLTLRDRLLRDGIRQFDTKKTSKSINPDVLNAALFVSKR